LIGIEVYFKPPLENNGGFLKNIQNVFKTQLFHFDSIYLAVPALIYALQNNLLFYALSNLDPGPYQVTNQGKIFTTAILSVFILNKKISGKKWIALILLFVGISLVQVQTMTDVPHTKKYQNVVLGASAVIASCFTSGFAGVYLEKILKSSKPSIWIRNIQLGFFGSLFGFIMSIINDGHFISEHGYFYGFNNIVKTTILVQAVGGLIIALVISLSDNIVKGFASAISIILSSLLSVWLFDYKISWLFVLGTTIVIYSSFLYSQPDPPRPVLNNTGNNV